jgi:hypothetical protein
MTGYFFVQLPTGVSASVGIVSVRMSSSSPSVVSR